MSNIDLQTSAEHALAQMRRQGFEHAQVSASATTFSSPLLQSSS